MFFYRGRFDWTACADGTGPLRAGRGTIDTSGLTVTPHGCWSKYPPIPHAAAAKAAFAAVLMNPSHRVVWFIDASGKLHLIGATNGISLILDQSVHG